MVSPKGTRVLIGQGGTKGSDIKGRLTFDTSFSQGPVSGSEESGSTTSLPSGPLPTDTAEKLDESFSSGEAHGLSPSTVNDYYLFFFQALEPI